MSEMVLVVPLLLLVLVMTVYFGKSLIRIQRSTVMDRYEAWRHVNEAPGPAVIDGDPDQINQTFHAARARDINYLSHAGFPTDAGSMWIVETESTSPDGADLLRLWLNPGTGHRLPTGRRVEFTTEYDSDGPLTERYDGPFTREHWRIGNSWKFVNGVRDIEGEGWADFRWQRTYPWSPDGVTAWIDWQPWPGHANFQHDGSRVFIYRSIDTAFFDDSFGDELQRLVDEDNALARYIQNIYLYHPSYFGPTVDFR